MTTQIPQQVLDDSTQAPADSAGAAIEALGEGVTETGQLILQGDWEALWARIAELWTGVLVGFVPRLVSAVFVGLFFFLLFLLVRRVASRILNRSRRVDAGVEALLIKTLNVVGLSFVGIIFLSQLGVNVAALVTGIGIAGIAIGLAARDTLENFIAGVTILLDRPFVVGDYIEIQGTYGQVRELTLRSTRITTIGNRTLVVPNMLMINQAVRNSSSPGRAGGLRVDVPFGIAYREYPQEARDVVLAALEGDERLMTDPAPNVVVTGLGDSSVDLMLRVHIENPGDEYAVRFSLIEKVREVLRDADIEIPFPHRQVFVEEVGGEAAGGDTSD